MKFSLDSTAGGLTINAYSDDGIQIGGHWYRADLLLNSEGLVESWHSRPAAELRLADFGPILDAQPEVLLLGTGHCQQFPPPELIAALAGRGIGIESMTTQAACRTYNILLSEGRRVAAALVIDG